jgi:hypothetical protein
MGLFGPGPSISCLPEPCRGGMSGPPPSPPGSSPRRPADSEAELWAYAPGLIGHETDAPTWVFWVMFVLALLGVGVLGLYLAGLGR